MKERDGGAGKARRSFGKPGGKPGFKADAKPGGKPGAKAGGKPGGKPGFRAGGKPGFKAGGGRTGGPGGNPGFRPGGARPARRAPGGGEGEAEHRPLSMPTPRPEGAPPAEGRATPRPRVGGGGARPQGRPGFRPGPRPEGRTGPRPEGRPSFQRQGQAFARIDRRYPAEAAPPVDPLEARKAPWQKTALWCKKEMRELNFMEPAIRTAVKEFNALVQAVLTATDADQLTAAQRAAAGYVGQHPFLRWAPVPSVK